MSKPNLGANADLNGAIAFSARSEWNIRVDFAPLDAHSAAIIKAISPEKGLKADFGSGLWEGKPIGIPYIVVPEGQSLKAFIETLWPDEGDNGPFPIPGNAPIEGGSDHHVIVVQRDPSAPNGLGKLYEIFDAAYNGKSWSGQAAVFDLQGGDHQRPDGFTSADAAGLPIFPGLVRYDEIAHAVKSGDKDASLGHALRFTLSQAHTAMSYVGAASHFADSIDGAAPFGAHFRLRSDFHMPANVSPEVRVIINTLKQYGMILADNGSDWFISGAPSGGWNNDDLRALSQVHGGDFEMVNSAALKQMHYGTSHGDVLNGNSGTNRLVGLGGGDQLNGKGGNDWLYGVSGADRLNGGAGRDVLTGGSGKDVFVFKDALMAANSDRIADFSHVDDVIHLDRAVFKAIVSGGTLAADAFHTGTAAADAEDRILYNKSTGVLSYDRDGSGKAGAVAFAVLTGSPDTLDHTDFWIL